MNILFVQTSWRRDWDVFTLSVKETKEEENKKDWWKRKEGVEEWASSSASADNWTVDDGVLCFHRCPEKRNRKRTEWCHQTTQRHDVLSSSLFLSTARTSTKLQATERRHFNDLLHVASWGCCLLDTGRDELEERRGGTRVLHGSLLAQSVCVLEIIRIIPLTFAWVGLDLTWSVGVGFLRWPWRANPNAKSTTQIQKVTTTKMYYFAFCIHLVSSGFALWVLHLFWPFRATVVSASTDVERQQQWKVTEWTTKALR